MDFSEGKKQYRPLPSRFMEVRKSPIDGSGLFTTRKIPKGTPLGITHIEVPNMGQVRTPLGGFINHSENPNCALVAGVEKGYPVFYLHVIKDISEGQELTLKYQNLCEGYE